MALKNLPNEHGAWVLLVVGLVVGVAANPGPHQAAAAALWLALFFARVPATRVLDRHADRVAWWMLAALTPLGLGAAAWLAVHRTAALGWALVAMIPGAVLVALRKRRFMRSLAGELLSMLAMAPLLPSMARAGDRPMDVTAASFLAVSMFAYLAAAVTRVRAVGRFGRAKASRAEIATGAGVLPLFLAVAGLGGLWSPRLCLAAAPAVIAGLALFAIGARRRVSLPAVGLVETAVVVPFAFALVLEPWVQGA